MALGAAIACSGGAAVTVDTADTGVLYAALCCCGAAVSLAVAAAVTVAVAAAVVTAGVRAAGASMRLLHDRRWLRVLRLQGRARGR